MSASVKLMLNRLKSKAHTFDAFDDATAYPAESRWAAAQPHPAGIAEVRVCLVVPNGSSVRGKRNPCRTAATPRSSRKARI
jgi:hypothetical protein